MTLIPSTYHKAIIASLDKFVADTLALGALYNPPMPNIKNDALKQLCVKTKDADAAESTAALVLNNARSARVVLIEKTADILTRSSNFIRILDLPENTKSDLIDLAHRFLGRSKVVHKDVSVDTPNGATIASVKTHTSSPQDIDSKIGYFDTFTKQLSLIKTYNPNEQTLKLESLTALLNELKNLRTAEITAESAHNAAVRVRNEVLYADGTGIVDITKDVKAYVKAVFGASSSQYKDLTSIKFKKYSV